MASTHPSKWHLQKGWGPDRLNGFSLQQEERPKVTMGIACWILMQFTQHDSPSGRAAKTYRWQTLSIDVHAASVFDPRREGLLTVSSKGQLNKPLIASFIQWVFPSASLSCYEKHVFWTIMVELTNHSLGEYSHNHSVVRTSELDLHAEQAWKKIAFKWIVKSSAQMVWLNTEREREWHSNKAPQQ